MMLTMPGNLLGGGFNLIFSEPSSLNMRILIESNLPATISNWSNIGTLREISTSHHPFTDTTTSGDGFRFFRVELQ
jgi:hypothetical protein